MLDATDGPSLCFEAGGSHALWLATGEPTASLARALLRWFDAVNPARTEVKRLPAAGRVPCSDVGRSGVLGPALARPYAAAASAGAEAHGLRRAVSRALDQAARRFGRSPR